MDERHFIKLSARLSASGRTLAYPPAPDLAVAFLQRMQGTERRRTLSWAFAIVLVIAASLLAVPEVRARILDFLQVGAVRIFLPQAPDAETNIAGAERLTAIPMTTTPSAPELLTSVLELDGETTLEDASAATDFPIDLPAYPSDLGEPDKVYLQELSTGKFVVLAWLDEHNDVELVLYVIGEGITLEKGRPDVIEATQVDGVLAIWVTGEYLLSVEGYQQPAKFVRGPVLIWVKGGVTYRLEADLPMGEMVRIAGSIN